MASPAERWLARRGGTPHATPTTSHTTWRSGGGSANPSGNARGGESPGSPMKTPVGSPNKSERNATPTSGYERGGFGTPEKFFRTGNERLYEAYNELHSLAQDFQKPFDAPAILVVGHQTDGKSALVEALMGFQFNHVGGGTKTRRPITLHMKYNAACIEPCCYLYNEDNIEEEVTLEELQSYIENENRRLERDTAMFWAKEIVVKIEYKYCPNLTIIDTPGLISAAPGRRNSQLQAAARAVENLVKSKMRQKEFVILCLEDTSDWSNATTRRLVMDADPELSRTVLVSTKFDTRIPQFSRSTDLYEFIHPSSRLLENTVMGGGPFFTSVPSGRVGVGTDSMYRSNEQFRNAVHQREEMDVALLEKRLDRPLEPQERSRIGISQLRRFLEQILQSRYLENVPSIVPLLEKEHRLATAKLRQISDELNDFDRDKLREKGRTFREGFLTKIELLMKGTANAPIEKFGETIADEHVRGGAFVGVDGQPLPHYATLSNSNMRLFGGAQYHRAMSEFRHVVGQMTCPAVSREEVVNACGVDEVHDGVNYIRAACTVAINKAKDTFEPFLYQLGYRLAHVVRRLLPIAFHLLQAEGTFLNGHELFLKRVGGSYKTFIESTEKSCRDICVQDLQSLTEYVTWSLHNKNRTALRTFLSNAGNPDIAPSFAAEESPSAGAGGKGRRSSQQPVSSSLSSMSNAQLVDVLDATLWNRKLGAVTEEIVHAIVCQVFEGIRDFYVQTVELKFNCFFLMPVLKKFPMKLREEIEAAYEEDLEGVFDVRAVRSALVDRRKALENELDQVESLQNKFTSIHATIVQPSPVVEKAVNELHRTKLHTDAPRRTPLASIR